MGRIKDTTENVCYGTHFNWNERYLLQGYFTGSCGRHKITNRRVLGEIFHKSERTIRRELKRGWILHEYSAFPQERWEYNAELADQKAKYECTAKGPNCKLGSDTVLCKRIKSLIVDKHYSPYAVIATFNKTGWPSKTRICEKTIYTYIQNGDISGVTEKDLLYKGKRRKPNKGPHHHSCLYNSMHSISNRPKSVETRKAFGDWEGDSVVGGKGNGSASMFTCIERRTRLEVIRKIPSRKKESVVKVFDTLEKETGSGLFKSMFNSVTFDNGIEFSAGESIVSSALTKGDRFNIYYAHPYTSCERGSNENHNGIIRRFIPKGVDITTIPKKEIRKIQDWMNTYPRKIFDGLSPIEKLMEIMGPDYKLPSYLAIGGESNE